MLPQHMHGVVLRCLLIDLMLVAPGIVGHQKVLAEVDLTQQQILGVTRAPRVALAFVVHIGKVEPVAKAAASFCCIGGIDLESSGEDAE